MSESATRQRLSGRSDLSDLQAYGSPQVDVPVRLNTNESPYPPPESFMQDVATRIAGLELNRYPDRDLNALREGLAGISGTLTERVWAANGSNEVLLQLALAFGGAERKAMTFEPSYSMHSHIIRISGTRLLRARRAPDHSLDLDSTVDAIRTQQPEIVILCSPNNPTGNELSEQEVRAIVAAAPGIVIIDEAYGEFASQDSGKLVDELDRVVVTKTFSKAWRLAGARIGFMVAQKWVLDEVIRARLPYHMSSVTQAVALTAIEHADELRSTIEAIRHERERLFRELDTTKGVTAYPSRANFILFRCDDQPASRVWQGLVDEGVLIRDFSDRPGCEESLRVSVGTPEEDERFLEALAKVASERSVQ